MSFIAPLYFWASIQSFFLAITILQFKKNRSNWYLVAFLVLTSLNILMQYTLIFTNVKFVLPQLLFVSDSITLATAPALYLYYRQLIYQEHKNANWFHFIPTLVFTLYVIIFKLGAEGPFKFHDYIGTTTHIVALNTILISSIIYLYLCWVAVKRVRNGSKIVEFRLLFWMEMLLVILILKTIFNVSSFGLHALLDADTRAQIAIVKNTIFIVSNTVIILGIQYFFIKYSHVINKEYINEQVDEEYIEYDEFQVSTDSVSMPVAKSSDNQQNNANDDTTKQMEDPAAKKDYSLILKEEAEGYIQQLENLMSNEMLFLDSELTERALAKALQVQPYFLSRLLNQHLGKRFNEYVNALRVEHAKTLLTNEQSTRYTMFAISVDSGFNSESAFYNNFKKFTGSTPKAYQQQFKARLNPDAITQ